MANPAAMMQAFQQLMQDPSAQQAMMQGAQQMGLDPRMLAQMAGGAGGMMQGPGGGPQAMPPDMGGAGPSGEGELPPEMEGAPTDPEQMASDQIDQAGNTWDGVDAPTQNDIDRLMQDPNPEAVASFDEQFGEGAAAEYLGEGGGAEASEEPEEGGPMPSEADEY
jgi:hypothetical protein